MLNLLPKVGEPERSLRAGSHRREDQVKRREFAAALTTVCLGIGTFPNSATSQQAGQAYAQFAGTWTLVSIAYVAPDGKRIEPFGSDARGMLFFDSAGHFATQVMTPHRPRFASNNRMSGTTEENRAMSQGVVAYFGTYSVDESKHLVTLHIDQSSFPNWNGTDQRRVYAFTTDELRYTAEASTANPAESAELVWRRAR